MTGLVTVGKLFEIIGEGAWFLLALKYWLKVLWTGWDSLDLGAVLATELWDCLDLLGLVLSLEGGFFGA